jgi:hypothetical protein
MDNIFEILIYIFIIVSFLSSLFKKKKKPGTTAGEQTARQPLETQSQPEPPQQEEYDLLKEIEKMLKTETSSPEKEKERSFETEKKFEPASKHLETTDLHKPTKSEHIYETWDDKRKKLEKNRKAVNKKIADQAAMFEKHLSRKTGSKAYVVKNIQERFSKPANLKEYIIFSEILGKPKAFSRSYFGQE